MISYQSSKYWRQSWLVALIGGLAVGALVWWWQGHSEDEAVTTASSQAASGRATAAPSSLTAPSGGTAGPTGVFAAEDDRPSDYTAEDWAALKVAMSRVPNGKAEMARIVSYLRFQRTFERWQALDETRDAQQRHQLAESLLARIPEHLAKADIMMSEALLMSTVLMADLVPDEGRREQRLEAWRQTLEAAVPSSDDEQRERQAQQLTEYKRRQAALVDEWHAKPAASRDQAKLEDDLEEARRAVYSDKP
ncbi:MAG: hypothetical protein KGL90_08940 [Burkholderiales bacterium]|nr:hypothetical protein [Burkholderiales bacterium]